MPGSPPLIGSCDVYFGSHVNPRRWLSRASTPLPPGLDLHHALRALRECGIGTGRPHHRFTEPGAGQGRRPLLRAGHRRRWIHRRGDGIEGALERQRLARPPGSAPTVWWRRSRLRTSTSPSMRRSRSRPPGRARRTSPGSPWSTRQPYIYDFDPPFRVRGGSAFILTVKGAGFVRGSKVLWNGTERATDYVSHTTLTATVRADDVATRGSAQVQVVEPAAERWPHPVLADVLRHKSDPDDHQLQPRSGRRGRRQHDDHDHRDELHARLRGVRERMHQLVFLLLV